MIINLRKHRARKYFSQGWKRVGALVLVLVCLSYFWVDIPLAIYCKGLPLGIKDLAVSLSNAIDPYFHYILWPCAYFFFRYVKKSSPLWAGRLLLPAISIPVANLIVACIKIILGRARPALFFSKHIYGFQFFELRNLELSFPSGHAATAGALAACLCCVWPEKKLYWLLGGFVFAFSRVIIEAHYLSDVIAGFAIGVFVGHWVNRQLLKRA